MFNGPGPDRSTLPKSDLLQMVHHTTASSDFYALLQIPRDASPADIKFAYHRTLLRLHPDKQSRLRRSAGAPALTSTRTRTTASDPVDMALLKEAYETLSDVELRAAYDGSLRRDEHARSRGPPRPAQVVSLDEFTFTPIDAQREVSTGSGTGVGEEEVVRQEWRYECRCGGTYRVTEDDLENGIHLVGCESCSEVIWAGYEEVMTEDEGATGVMFL